MSDEQQPDGEVLWPNRYPVKDGIEPVSQDPDLFAEDFEDPDVLAQVLEADTTVRTLKAPRTVSAGTVDQMIAQAIKSLGTTEHPPGSNHNDITVWYNANVDKIGDGAWCDMSVTMWGVKSGSGAVVGEFAYTVYHAQWFQRRGQWHSGTSGIKRGDVVFFDWSGSRSIGAIDHVGVVEKVSGGTIYTIEGNTSGGPNGDWCARKARNSTYIVGYGRPTYAGAASSWMEAMMRDLPLLKKGDAGEDVETLQGLLLARSHPEVKITGKFDDTTDKAVRAVQKWGGVGVDGQVGQQTWPVLITRKRS